MIAMQEAQLRASWIEAWRGLGVTTPEPALYDELLARHREPHRAYHTLQHIGECLAWLEQLRDEAERPAELALALCFHDAIYDVRRHDNEARSAAWACHALQAAGLGTEVAARVHALVMATRHHDAPSDDPDARLLVDIDLSILGAPEARFAEYEQQIRIEYGHITPALFEPRRREILGQFLARDPLYRTAALHERLEAAARRNLRRAVGA